MNNTQQNTIEAVQKLADTLNETIPHRLFGFASQNFNEEHSRETYSTLFRDNVCESFLLSIADQLFRWNAAPETLGHILASKHFGGLVVGLINSMERKTNAKNNRKQHERAIARNGGCVRSRGSKQTSLLMSVDSILSLTYGVIYNACDQIKLIVPFDIRETTNEKHKSHMLDRRFYDVYCKRSHKWYSATMNNEQHEAMKTFIKQNGQTPDVDVYLPVSFDGEKITKISFTYQSTAPLVSSIFAAISRFKTIEFANSSQVDPMIIETRSERRSAGYRETFQPEFFEKSIEKFSPEQNQVFEALRRFPNYGEQRQAFDEYNLFLEKPIGFTLFRERVSHLYEFASRCQNLVD